VGAPPAGLMGNGLMGDDPEFPDVDRSDPDAPLPPQVSVWERKPSPFPSPRTIGIVKSFFLPPSRSIG